MPESTKVVVEGIEIWVDEKTECVRFKCGELSLAIPYESWPIIDRLVESGFHRANHDRMKDQVSGLMDKMMGGDKPPDWSK